MNESSQTQAWKPVIKVVGFAAKSTTYSKTTVSHDARVGESSPYNDRDEAVANSSILVVDDNVDMTLSLKYLLESLGYTVNCAYEGRAALHAAHIHKPDIVILDIGLPGMNGFDVARRLRADFPNKPLLLIASTGYGQAQDFRRTRQAGFDYHLVKPLDIGHLMAIIAEYNENC